jgi:hypothetical protein
LCNGYINLERLKNFKTYICEVSKSFESKIRLMTALKLVLKDCLNKDSKVELKKESSE